MDGSGSYERQAVALINDIRNNRGLPDFQANIVLTQVARGHSRDMACNSFFSHTSPTTGSPYDRLANAGYSFSWAGENIAAGYGTANDLINAWMNSSGHRDNLLSPDFTQVGIGYAFLAGSPYGVYATAVFGTP